MVIPDAHTQRFITSTLKHLHWPWNGVWIGASDRQSEMNWRWVTNHLVKRGYSNWASGQPSCHIFCFEDCALMRLDDGGKWHDYKCSWIEDYSYICQYPMRPKTTSTSTTTTTTTTASTTVKALTTKRIFTTTNVPKSTEQHVFVTLTPLLNSTVNSTGVVVNLQPDIKVELSDNIHWNRVQQAGEEHNLDAGSVVGLILGLVCGICLGLCLGVFVFRRRHQKKTEELPTVVFANPYYAETVRPLARRPYHCDSADCCFGASAGAPSTPVKETLRVDLNRQENLYNDDPTQAAEDLLPKTLAHGGIDPHGEMQHSVLFHSLGQRAEEQGAYGGEDATLWDNHYDYTTGENFYESVENVRSAIEQNIQNQQYEDTERYVPFRLDSA